MKVVVITGGIGSGKSVACDYLHRKFGFPVYEADGRVKHLYDSHPTLLSEIEEMLNVGLRAEDGKFVPQKLASVIFNDGEALAKVESLVFPALIDDFDKWTMNHSDCPAVILESATILEKPQLGSVGDLIVVIDAPTEVRLARAAARDDVSEELILQRMSRQKLMNDISSGLIPAPADVVIANVGKSEILYEKLDEFVQKYGITKKL